MNGPQENLPAPEEVLSAVILATPPGKVLMTLWELRDYAMKRGRWYAVSVINDAISLATRRS